MGKCGTPAVFELGTRPGLSRPGSRINSDRPRVSSLYRSPAGGRWELSAPVSGVAEPKAGTTSLVGRGVLVPGRPFLPGRPPPNGQDALALLAKPSAPRFRKIGPVNPVIGPPVTVTSQESVTRRISRA